MKKTLKFTSVLLISIYIIILLPSVGAYACETNITVNPTSNSDIQSRTDSWLQENLDYQSCSFTITYEGDWLSNNYSLVGGTITPSQKYFTEMQPLVDLLYSSGNEYTLLSLSNENSIGFQRHVTTYGSKISTISITYTLNYGESADETNAVEYYAKNKVSELGISSMSEYDKVKTLNEFVINNFSYDYNYNVYYTYDFITGGHKGVCQAYAGLMYQLFKAAGLQSRIIMKDSYADPNGNPTTGDDHAWNLVKVNGNWYHIDVTWNDTGGNKDTYFLKSDLFMQSTHSWNQSFYPSAPLNYSPTNPVTSETSKSKSTSSKSSSSVSKTTKSNVSSAVSSETASESESQNSESEVLAGANTDNSNSATAISQSSELLTSLDDWYTNQTSFNNKFSYVKDIFNKYYYLIFGLLLVVSLSVLIIFRRSIRIT